ncbi:plastocyanin [Jatrophihabitans sp. GAS493]|uniref:cupredoxin domain-containing protein n=1 Tax=Jatrophihabitans sp. GAS493 TaxID=1907575 RepID=UPI000BBFD720|nr:cupredoxin domain-containing protein [Jatrophihabitans sp. GAS493]SOD71894.1 plastocyanin [Jatrophihabitans sp. GAS493]
MMRRVHPCSRAVGPLLVLALGATLTGCQSVPPVNRGGHSGATTATVVNGVQSVTITTDDHYRFDPSTITVHPGKVKITLVNNGHGAPHDLQVVGLPGDYVPLTQGSSTSVATFDTPAPGKYTFICTIHVKQGQTGVLIVLPS